MMNVRFKKIFLMLLMFMFLVPLGAIASAKNVVIDKITIKSTSDGSKDVPEDLIRSILPIKEGDIFTSEELDNTINYLRKWGVFETISATSAPSNKGTEVIIFVKAAILIGEIDISGNYPYISNKIRKYLTIRPGDMYTPDRVQEQIKRIQDFYEREGFLNTNVTYKEFWNEDSRDVRILFKIKHGSVLRYRNINIVGMHAYPPGRLVSAINPMVHYQPRKFNDAIRKVSDFYHLHGYPRARIDVKEKKPDYETGHIDFDIVVSEGPYIDIDFVGNNKMSSSKLLKVITIYKDASYDEYEIDASKEEIIKFYRQNGFPNTKVSSSRNIPKNIITFTIKEGERERINNINIEGNKNIPDRRLLKQMQTKTLSLTNKGVFDVDVLNNDLKRLKEYYSGEGFLNPEINAPEIKKEHGRVFVTIPVEEDGQTIVKNITFSGNTSVSEKTLLKTQKNKIGRHFNQLVLEEDKKNLLIYYADNGYPYAKVEQSVDLAADGDKKTATIKYQIEQGEHVSIGKILVVGNTLTTVHAIKRAMQTKEGEPYSYQKIVDSQLALRRIGVFNSVSVNTIGLNDKKQTVHLVVKIEEQKPFVLDTEIGYSTDDSVQGSMSFTNLNSFGIAKKSKLKLTGGKKLSRAEGSWIDPSFLGTSLEMNDSAWFQYENKNVFAYLQAGGGFGFFRRFHRTGLIAKWELMRNYFVQGDSTAADADSLRNNTISKIGLSANFDTRNNFAEPSKGIFAMMNSDFYNEIKGQEANFVKLKWTFGVYNGLWNRITFSNNFRVADIETIGENISVPSNELLLLGGDDTIRGFPQYSLGPKNASGRATGGRFEWIYNLETQIRIIGNFRLAGFFDMGALVNDAREISGGNIRRSAGGGIRYMTPVGPIRLDYGIVLDRKAGDSFGRLHFTFGYVF